MASDLTPAEPQSKSGSEPASVPSSEPKTKESLWQVLAKSQLLGVLLGGVITGVPAIFGSYIQFHGQLELAKREEAQQARERRVAALKNYLRACAEGPIWTQRMIRATGPAFQAIYPQWQEVETGVLIAVADVKVEFPDQKIDLGPYGGLLKMSTDPKYQSMSPAELLREQEKMVREVDQTLVSYDKYCKGVVMELLAKLREDLAAAAW